MQLILLIDISYSHILISNCYKTGSWKRRTKSFFMQNRSDERRFLWILSQRLSLYLSWNSSLNLKISNLKCQAENDSWENFYSIEARSCSWRAKNPHKSVINHPWPMSQRILAAVFRSHCLKLKLYFFCFCLVFFAWKGKKESSFNCNCLTEFN